MKQSKFGFTLVELLIVIALLGALAVGLLAALDPFEQLKKGTDTGIRNTVSELQGAAIRYYAIKGYMPWCTEQGTCGIDPNSTRLDSDAASVIIGAMAAAGELKTNFNELAAAYNTKIYMTGSGSDEEPSMKVCFIPQSKAFRADPNTKYTVTAIAVDDPTTCKGHTNTAGDEGTIPCYWCVM